MSYNETFIEEYRPKPMIKLLALILCAAFLFSCLPITAVATTIEEDSTPKEEVV